MSEEEKEQVTEEEEQVTEEEEEVTEEQEESENESESEEDSEYDDPEGFVDDIPDEELMKDLMKDKPVMETSYDNIIVVDNAPKVGPDRMTKLQSVLTKVFSRFGIIVSQDYPVDDAGLFKGYFFLEFSTPDEAASAVKTGNGYRLDKSHIFKVNFFSDFDKYSDIPEKWEPPERTEFTEIGNLRSWLQDENCYDQCSVLYSGGEQVAIAQCSPQELKVVMEREHWTIADLHWSPKGSYLATLHKMGIALWGTKKFIRVNKFEHQGVQHIDFSPCEKYLVTFSNIVDDPDDPQNIVIWDISTGARKRSFSKGSAENIWPIIKWSCNGEYFARMAENLLSVYTLPSFGLLDLKSLIIKGIRDFSWSPTDSKIAYWVPGKDSIPAKITIIEIPSRKEICTKSRHDVSECKLQWHKQGDYLCVKVDHWMTKSKKQMCHSFEIFHIREHDIPVDTIEIKEPVAAFALEPHGSRFGIIHGEPPTRISASFYAINDRGNKLIKIATLERQHANNIFWCPNGHFVVLAGLKEMEGHLEFYDINDMTMMNSVDHTNATDLEWDPTGRYVVTSVSVWNQKMDTGFNIWSFQGKPLYRNPAHIEKFCQFLWRPRPPSLLTEEDIKTIRKDYKRYHHMFEQKDKTTRSKASKDLIDKRKKLMDRYKDYRKKKEQEIKQKTKKFAQSVALEEEPEATEYEEETMEVFVSEKQEYIIQAQA